MSQKLQDFEAAFYAWAFGHESLSVDALKRIKGPLSSNDWEQCALRDAHWLCTDFGRLVALHAPEVFMNQTPVGFRWLFERTMWKALKSATPFVQTGLLHLVEHMPLLEEFELLESAYPSHIREAVWAACEHENPTEEDYYEASQFLSLHGMEGSENFKYEAKSADE